MLELNISKEWADAVYRRSAVRQYTGAPDEAQLARLGQLARKLSWQGVTIRLFQGPGLRGSIHGTDVYAVIVAKQGTPMETEGYMGEALVLEATAMGLGTCWLAKGFYADVISQNVKLAHDEAIHCVIAIGKCTLPPFAPKRKPLEKICDMTEAQLDAVGAWQAAAVKAAHVAPSALNLQQWKLKATGADITFSDEAMFFKKYTALDRGICMLHAAVGAASLGRTPKWKKVDDQYVLTA